MPLGHPCDRDAHTCQRIAESPSFFTAYVVAPEVIDYATVDADDSPTHRTGTLWRLAR